MKIAINTENPCTYENILPDLVQNQMIWNSLKESKMFLDTSLINANLIKTFQNHKNNIFFYFAKYHPEKQKLKDLSVYIQQKIDLQNSQGYTIVFFNHQAHLNAYSQFKNIFMCLPEMYFKNLRSIILIKPKFFQKKVSNALIYGNLKNFYNQHFFTLDNCYQLCQILKISQKTLLNYLPQSIKSQQYPQFKGLSLTNHRVNYIGQSKKQNGFSDLRWIELIVSSFVETTVQQIEDYPVNQNRVPVVLDVLIMYFRVCEEKLQTQGLFRKSIGIDDEKQALEAIKKYDFEYFSEGTDPHIVAVTIKKIFANLKTPLLDSETFQTLTKKWDKNEGGQNNIFDFKIELQKLSDTKFQTLSFVFQFFKQDVLKYQAFNQMSLNNISTCFGPCIIRCQCTNLMDQVEKIEKANKITGFMIQNYKQLFNKDKKNKILSKSLIQDKKLFVREVFGLKLQQNNKFS